MRVGVATLLALSLAGCASASEVPRFPARPEVESVRLTDDSFALQPARQTHATVSLGYIGDGVLGGGATRDTSAPTRTTHVDALPFFSAEMDTYVPPRGRGSSRYTYSWRGRSCAYCRGR